MTYGRLQSLNPEKHSVLCIQPSCILRETKDIVEFLKSLSATGPLQ